jgi:hypothetical protein
MEAKTAKRGKRSNNPETFALLLFFAFLVFALP